MVAIVSKEQYSFVYGNETLFYKVIRKSMKIEKRKITIKVLSSCEVIVISPKGATEKEIHNIVMKRAKWIYESLNVFRSRFEFVENKEYVSGEMLFYLGRRYVLKVIEDKQALTSVKMFRGKIIVTLSRFKKDKVMRVKELLINWYKIKAEKIIHERLVDLLPLTPWVEDIPSFKIITMKKRWGSCSAKGNLVFNMHLVKAPKECIDYVILHELCHIAEHNHSKRFWNLLTSVMPEWKEVKIQLDEKAGLYLSE